MTLTPIPSSAVRPAPPPPTSWDEFRDYVESQWGAVDSWGAKEWQALTATAGALVKTFNADVIAFVKAESDALLGEIQSGHLSLMDAATAVLNAAEAKVPGLLAGFATNAIISLIATFVAGL
jgi:hypothetical protein